MQCDQAQNSRKKVTNAKHGNKKKKNNNAVVFKAQVNCLCKRKCAENIDVVTQQDTFEKFTKLHSWSSQTKYLRTLISKKPTKEPNLDPIIGIKRKENSYNYHFLSENGSLTQVCLHFFANVLQINRGKIFRSMKSCTKNPQAIERRGGPKSRRTPLVDRKYLRDFISKFVSYESHSPTFGSNVSNIKYLHPRLTLRKCTSCTQKIAYLNKEKI